MKGISISPLSTAFEAPMDSSAPLGAFFIRILPGQERKSVKTNKTRALQRQCMINTDEKLLWVFERAVMRPATFVTGKLGFDRNGKNKTCWTGGNLVNEGKNGNVVNSACLTPFPSLYDENFRSPHFE